MSYLAAGANVLLRTPPVRLSLCSPTTTPRRWLGLIAFLRVLRRKQTRYGELLAQLEELASAPALRSAARQLAAVVDPSRSSAFAAILY